MGLRITLVIAVLVLASFDDPGGSHKAKQSVFSYQNAYGGDPTFVIDLEELLISQYDLDRQIYLCDSDSDFICIESDVLFFAVPKVGGDLPKSWSFRGRKFSNVTKFKKYYGESVEDFFNIELDCYDSSGVCRKFVYSKKRGLLEFSTIRNVNLDGIDLSVHISPMVAFGQGFGSYPDHK